MRDTSIGHCRTFASGPVGFIAAITALLIAAPLRAQDPGLIAGKALAAETGRPLAGARVVVDGTAIAAVTDASGRFTLTRVPAGSRRISLSFIGRVAQVQDVTVTPGQMVQVEFSAPALAVQVEGITVLGARATAQAEALSRQMNAPNITNIVASDQMGRFPDASAPEAVQRLPGVAVERDQGEGRYIQIRGGAAANTQVTFNGVEVPSPEGEERQIALDAVPVDILSSIEVSKAILPDMDADAIGGAVNLVTLSAPTERIAALEAAGGFGTIRSGGQGGGSLTLGSRFAENRLGLLVSGSYNRRNFGSDDLEPDYDLGDPGMADDELVELQTRHYSLWRSRAGGTGSLDYHFNDHSTVTVKGVFSQLVDVEQRRNFVSVVEDDELAFLHKNRREELTTWNLSAGGEHLLPAGLTLDYHASYARSGERTPYDTEIEFVQEDVDYDPDLSDPENIQANPEAGSENGTFIFNEVQPASSETHNEDRGAALNLAIPFGGGGVTGRVKFGSKLQDRKKMQDVTERAFELIGGAPDIVLGQDVGEPFRISHFNPGTYRFAPSSTSPDDVIGFTDRFASSLDGETDMEAETNDYDLNERVLAGYAMTELNLTPRLMVLPGVRFEQTRVTSSAFAFDPDTEILTPVTGGRTYANAFPMLHVRYTLGARSNIRAAYTTTIARPNFYQLVPYRVRDDEDRQLGNPALDPTTARSFDLMLEHYDRHIGVISAGAFYKQLSNPIFVFTTDNELGGEDEQPRNGESATIRGVELAVQQQLRFLPAPLDGLGIYANYTYTDSDATLPGGRQGRLQGQAQHVFNTALSYERSRFSSQVSLNYHGNYLSEYGGDEGTPEERFEDVFVDRHLQLDLSASLRTGRSSAIFLELVNLTNEPFTAYRGVQERPIQREFYERWGRLGFRMSL